MPTQVQIHDCPIPYPFEVNLARGGLIAHKSAFVFGFNSDINGTEETIWTKGGIYQYPTVASTMTLSSTSANDASAGTGARTVLVSGLDADYNEVTETVALNGQTGVSTTNSYLRINDIRVITAGSTGAAEGTISIGTGTITSGVPANVYSEIVTSDNHSLDSVWTVPAGYTAYVYRGTVSSGTANSNQYVTARLMVRPYGQVLFTAAKITLQTGFIEFDFGIPVIVPEKSDIETRAVSSGSNNVVSATYTIMYTKN